MTVKMLNAVLITSLFVTLVSMPAMGGDPCGAEETLATPDGELFVYVGDTVEVWEQSNILPGLQRASCDDGNGRMLAPDTQVL